MQLKYEKYFNSVYFTNYYYLFDNYFFGVYRCSCI